MLAMRWKQSLFRKKGDFVKKKILITTITGLLALLPLMTAYSLDDSKFIEGNWLIIEAEIGGKKIPDEGFRGRRLSLKDGKYSSENDLGEYKIDPKAKIRSIDITFTEGSNKGKTILAIYELQNDSLRICYDLDGKSRPKEFMTKSGTKQFMVTYRREKE
jgi:uncharacterized protein (TIGR03067 family)